MLSTCFGHSKYSSVQSFRSGLCAKHTYPLVLVPNESPKKDLSASSIHTSFLELGAPPDGERPIRRCQVGWPGLEPGTVDLVCPHQPLPLGYIPGPPCLDQGGSLATATSDRHSSPDLQWRWVCWCSCMPRQA